MIPPEAKESMDKNKMGLKGSGYGGYCGFLLQVFIFERLGYI